MKKFLSLLLAALMLCSCAVALAESTDKNMTIEYGDDSVGFRTTANTSEDFGGYTSAEQSTDLWLQVEASGQIDVEIPLVLVFKTNIDGGNATTANTYKLSNKSTAPLAVTEISFTEENADKMELVEKADSYATDKYSVVLNVANDNKTENGNAYAYDLGGDKGDKKTSALSTEGGLFVIPKSTVSEGTVSAGEVVINAEMATGALSFVTKEDGTGEDTSERYGLQLLEVKYVVGISELGAVDDVIKGENIPASEYVENAEGENVWTDVEYGYTGVKTEKEN